MRVSGIYSITNTVNGKKYYGSSVNVWQRKRQHEHTLRKGNHHNEHLQAAWNLYGRTCFRFELIEEAPPDKLVTAEQTYLNENTNGYNIGKDADCPSRGLKRTDEQKLQQSIRQRGKKLSEDTKQKLSIAGKGRKVSEETKRKLSEANKGKCSSPKTKKRISKKVKTLWKDKTYRQQMIEAQTKGRQTPQAKENYSASSLARWANPKYLTKMRKLRKKMWSSPEFKAKMLKIRKRQGQKLREKNLRKREMENACT